MNRLVICTAAVILSAIEVPGRGDDAAPISAQDGLRTGEGVSFGESRGTYVAIEPLSRGDSAQFANNWTPIEFNAQPAVVRLPPVTSLEGSSPKEGAAMARRLPNEAPSIAWPHLPPQSMPSAVKPDSFALMPSLVERPQFQLAQRDEWSAGTALPEPHPNETVERQSSLTAAAESELAETAIGVGDTTNSGIFSQLPAAATNGAWAGPVGGAIAANQSTDNDPWSFVATQTVDYVTNLALPITVEPANATNFQSDWQFQSSVFGQYQVFADKQQSLVAYGNYYQSLHPIVVQIDLNVFTAGLLYTRKVSDSVTTSLSYDYSYFYLHDISFLSRNRIGPTVQWSVNPCLDLQASYFFSDNEYRQYPTQTSGTHSVQLQAIRYLDDAHTSYGLAGIAYGRNNARLDLWTYNVYSGFCGVRYYYGQDSKNDVSLLASYGSYEFVDFVFNQVNFAHNNDITTLVARYTRRVSDHWSVLAQYTILDSKSPFKFQDYTSQLWSVGLVANW